MDEPLYKAESFKVIGLCMEVHNHLGRGFSEVVSKDALEIEFRQNSIPFLRERSYPIQYKGVVLPHSYIADFVVFDLILLEIKAIECLTKAHEKLVLNYLAASKLRLGLLVNFGETSLASKRVIL
jgi:GxxExxY protein